MKQSEIFLKGEAAEWYARNQDKLPVENDAVLEAINNARLTPKNVLEVGCANGWRLNALTERYGSECQGVDPAGIMNATGPFVFKGTADNLGFLLPESFDLVIYGFCLYLVDRSDLFKVVAECDRVLQEGGHVVIHDFTTSTPHAVPYKHKAGVKSFKMNYADLWVGNPAYRHVYHMKRYDKDGDGHTGVTILRKSNKLVWGA